MSAFNRRGRTGVYFLPSLASPAAPSAAAILAGEVLHEDLMDWSGFDSTVEQLDNSDLGSPWAGTLPGGETPGSPSLTIRAGDDALDAGEALRASLVEGAEGFIVITKWSKVPTAADPAGVFPVRVSAVNDVYAVTNAIAQYTVAMSIYDPPFKHVDIAA